jgi:hypothetical protein
MSNLTAYTDQATKLMASSTRSIEAARKSSAAIVADIISDPDSASAMEAFFKGARGSYLAFRREGAKLKATTQGKAWKLLREAMDHHFANAGFKATWPNWASGDGAATLTTKADASAKAKADASARAERDAAQLAEHEAEQATAELTALRELGPTDLALSLASTLSAWSDNAEMVRQALAELAGFYHLALMDLGDMAKPAAAKPAAAKPAAAKPAAVA